MKRLALILLALFALSTASAQAAPSGAVFYVVTSGNLYAYQIGAWNQISHVSLPFSGGIRGTAFDVSRDSLYITYGGHSGTSGNGSMMRYDLVTGKVVFNIHYSHGVDMPAVCGGKVYVPAGSGSTGSTWYVVSADTGAQTGTLTGGKAPHNTICHNGIVYMGGEDSAYLYATGRPRAGPVSPLGIRPFTVNAADTRAWVTQSNHRGFSVLNTTTGARLSTVTFGSGGTDPPSHGISLNPAGSEVYVIDRPTQSVRVYTSSDSPKSLATVKLKHAFTGSEQQCSGSCTREGWLLHSLSGQYVFVGDSGDVINTGSRSVVAYLPALQNSRHGFLEVDWSGGQPVATSTHFGVGH